MATTPATIRLTGSLVHDILLLSRSTMYSLPSHIEIHNTAQNEEITTYSMASSIHDRHVKSGIKKPPSVSHAQRIKRLRASRLWVSSVWGIENNIKDSDKFLEGKMNIEQACLYSKVQASFCATFFNNLCRVFVDIHIRCSSVDDRKDTGYNLVSDNVLG